MPPPILWEREVCQALKIHTEQELDAYLEKTRGALQEIMDLAVRFGWVQEAIYGNFVASYPPGSYRPWSLDLTVYDGDSLLGEKAFLKQASSPAPRGVRFERFERNSGLFLFVKARLRGKLTAMHACPETPSITHALTLHLSHPQSSQRSWTAAVSTPTRPLRRPLSSSWRSSRTASGGLPASCPASSTRIASSITGARRRRLRHGACGATVYVYGDVLGMGRWQHLCASVLNLVMDTRFPYPGRAGGNNGGAALPRRHHGCPRLLYGQGVLPHHLRGARGAFLLLLGKNLSRLFPYAQLPSIKHNTPLQAGKRAGIPDSFGPDARFLIRKPLKSAQRTNEFRSAVAFALAIDRLVPEQRRRVLITAPCTNGDAVPGFESAQLENPVTPEVRSDRVCQHTISGARIHRSLYPPNPQLEKDRSFALPLESLRAGLAKIGLDPDGGGGGGGGVGGGPAASSSAAASSSLSAAHLEGMWI